MASPDQTGLHQRTGYTEQTGEYVNTDKGYNGPPQQAYPVQQSYGPSTQGAYPQQYQGQELGRNEYVDRHGQVKRRRRGTALACCLAACWCCTWPCHGPCCGGL